MNENPKTSRKRRDKGNGHIYKKAGTYYAQFKINGKRKTISLKTGNKKEAEIKAKQHFTIINSKTNEKLAVHVQKARELDICNEITISDAWNSFLEDPARPDSGIGTLKNYKSNLNRFTKWLLEEKPQIISFNQIDTYIAKEYAKYLYGTGISAKTFNDHIKALMLIYRILMNDSGYIQNPFDRNNIFRKIERKQGREKLSRDQIKLVLNAFDDVDLSLMYKEETKLLFYIGAYTELRLCDCVFLQWSDIDFENNLIRCMPRKTERIQRNVVIPLFPQLKEKLLHAKLCRFNSYVLPNISGRYDYNDHGVRKDNLKVFRYCGFATTYENKNGIQRQRKANRFGFHSLRHSFASILAEKGVDIIKLCKIMGDDSKTLEKYYININDSVIKNISITL